MSYANGTTHYNLPQTVGTDKRDWADPNQAFADIDAAIYGAVQDTAQAALDINALEGRMDTAEQGISTNAGNIAGLDTRLTTAEGAITSQGAQITDTRQDLEDMICAYNEASATSTHAYAIGDYFIYNDVLYKATAAIGIGDTIVPDTNCATTNVTTELLAIDTSNFVPREMISLYTESSTTASRAYAINDFFILNDTLYRVTAPIASGASIVAGTNCTSSSVCEEINKLQPKLIYTASSLAGTGTFNATLTESIRNFRFLDIDIHSNAGASAFKGVVIRVPIEVILNSSSGNEVPLVTWIFDITGIFMRGRLFNYIDDTHLRFTDGFVSGTTIGAATSLNNDVGIIANIYGIY